MGIEFDPDNGKKIQSDASMQAKCRKMIKEGVQPREGIAMNPHFKVVEVNPDPTIVPIDYMTGEPVVNYKPTDENLISRLADCMVAKKKDIKVNEEGYRKLVEELENRGYDVSDLQLPLTLGINPSMLVKKSPSERLDGLFENFKNN